MRELGLPGIRSTHGAIGRDSREGEPDRHARCAGPDQRVIVRAALFRCTESAPDMISTVPGSTT